MKIGKKKETRVEARDCPFCGGPLTFLNIKQSSRSFYFDEDGELTEEDAEIDFDGEQFVKCDNDETHDIRTGFLVKHLESDEDYESWIDQVWDEIYEEFYR